jgi:phosphoglycerate dehydrogenase-like enzyme
MTPHLGGVTNKASERSRSWPVDNIIGFLEGRPVPIVTG